MQAVAKRVRMLKRGLHSMRPLVIARHNQSVMLERRRRRNGAEFLSESGDWESQKESEQQGDAFQGDHIVLYYSARGNFQQRMLSRQSNRK